MLKTDSERWLDIAEMVEEPALRHRGLCEIAFAMWIDDPNITEDCYLNLLKSIGYFFPVHEEYRPSMPYYWPLEDRQSRVIACLLLSEMTK